MEQTVATTPSHISYIGHYDDFLKSYLIYAHDTLYQKPLPKSSSQYVFPIKPVLCSKQKPHIKKGATYWR